MVRSFKYSMLSIGGVVALVSVWSPPVWAETPLHRGATLAPADFDHLARTAQARAKKNRAKLEKACKAGDGAACYMLGKVLVEQRDAIETRIYGSYKAACGAGHADGCFEQGRMEMQSVGGPDADAAILMFSKGCDGGAAPACFFKADLLNDGELLPQDLEAARAAEYRGAELLRRQGVEFTAPIRGRRSSKAQ